MDINTLTEALMLLFSTIKLLVLVSSEVLLANNVRGIYLEKVLPFKTFTVTSGLDKIKNNNKNGKISENVSEIYKQYLINFIETIENKLSHVDKTLFYNNIKKASIESSDRINNLAIIYQLFGYRVGGMCRENDILIFEKSTKKTQVLYHELMHLASCASNSDLKIYGFCHMKKCFPKDCIGHGLNEGYTELLTQRYFPDTVSFNAYLLERLLVKRLENIIGKDKMEQMYFKGNLLSLIKELEQYKTYEEIITFLRYFDVFNISIFSPLYINNNNMKNYALNFINDFLLDCHTKKLRVAYENNEISVNELDSEIDNILDEYNRTIQYNKKSSYSLNKEMFDKHMRELDEIENRGKHGSI